MTIKEGTLLPDGGLVAGPALAVSKPLFRLLLPGFPKLKPPELDLSPPPNRLPPVATPLPNAPNKGGPDVAFGAEKGFGFDEAGVPLLCPKRVPVVVEVLVDGWPNILLVLPLVACWLKENGVDFGGSDIIMRIVTVSQTKLRKLICKVPQRNADQKNLGVKLQETREGVKQARQ